MPPDPSPLILTLAFHVDDQARFERLRQAHFPPERNLIPAHATLFHHLPGAELDAAQALLGLACGSTDALRVDVTGLRSLGRGVAYVLQSAALATLRASLARAWHDVLTPQDRQGWRPHVTIQNKVAPAEAATLLASMQAAFSPFQVRAEGVDLWRYLGGPWQHLVRVPFTPAPPP